MIDGELPVRGQHCIGRQDFLAIARGMRSDLCRLMALETAPLDRLEYLLAAWA
jgi:hypothetical protein